MASDFCDDGRWHLEASCQVSLQDYVLYRFGFDAEAEEEEDHSCEHHDPEHGLTKVGLIVFNDEVDWFRVWIKASPEEIDSYDWLLILLDMALDAEDAISRS